MHRDVTVIGASGGSIAPLRQLLSELPADYPAAVFIVVHLAPEAPTVLHTVLNRVSNMPVGLARSGARICTGTVTVACPDLHLLLERDRVIVARGPRENRHRPAIDVLFRSAAVAFGRRVIGVVLSGMLDDGAAGLWAIKQRGGAAVVQDPDDAEFPDMPKNALQATLVDHRVPVREMSSVLMRLATETLRDQEQRPVPPAMAKEVRMAARSNATMEDLDQLGKRVPLTCPECGGTLWELDNGGARFRCHTGHGYTINSLAAEQSVQVEAALWAGLRRLEESERLYRHMEHGARTRGNERSALYHAEMARSSAGHADTLRELLREKSSAPGASETE